MGVGVITVRPMTAADLDEVVLLEQASQPRPWSRQVFLDELSAENRAYLVAGDEGIDGFGGVMVIGDEAHVTNLLVASHRRRRGLGRALMSGLVEAGIAAGARHLTLEVRSRNHPARSMYAALGLAPVGIRRNYYGDDDAVIMWAHDIDRPEYLESLR
ncbi:MAG: ribosomal protein S18-alanine N-acetyltransferase [Acidimicrobiia bacterium]